MALKTLNRQCGAIKAKLTAFETQSEQSDFEKLSRTEIQCKVDSINRTESLMDNIRIQYYELAKDDELEEIDNSLENMEQRIEKIKVSLLTFIQSDSNSNATQVSMSENVNISKFQNSVLPSIHLPTFDGTLEEFSSFKTAFICLMQSHSHLTDSQKLFYLRSCLQGKAKLVETPDDNFESLMKALTDRYENRRLLMDTHINNILHYPSIMHESAKELHDLLDSVNKNIRALKLLKFEPNDFSNALLFNIILPKLDKNSRIQFEQTIQKQDVPEFENLLEFLKKRSHMLEAITRNAPSKPFQINKPNVNKIQRSKSLFVKSQTSNCNLCKDDSHSIYKCSKFKSMSISERYETVKNLKLCFNCLHHSHMLANCKSKVSCSTCKRNSHHSLLHRNDPANPQLSTKEGTVEQSPPADSSQEVGQTNSVLFTKGNEKYVLINTAIVYIRDSLGRKRPFRAILDSACQSNFITSEAARFLGIQKEKVNVPISGLNEFSLNIKSKINAHLSDANDNNKWYIDLLIVPKITDITPPTQLNISKLKIPHNITLADNEFHKSNTIQILLGCELFFHFLKSEKIYLEDNLVCQNSCFGYLVSGSTDVTNINRSVSSNQNCFLTMEGLNDSIKSFWEIETIEDTSNIFSSEEVRYCDEHFKRTHYRNSDGRYIVQMPLKPEFTEQIPLGDSKTLALLRLEQLWRRLEREPEMKILYTSFMKEYEDLGHMTPTIEETDTRPEIFLPHHGVYRPQSSSTKLRVVFNASSKTTNGYSLNDLLFKGGVIQEDLFSILLRFRKHLYAFSADIEKMFRQIQIDPSQTSLQRILWKKNINDPVQTYDLKTVTYGTASAPYLATRTLYQLALDEKESFPLASSVISDFYMDDCLTGSSDISNAIEIQQQLIKLLERAGMSLHKWCSNIPELQIGDCKVYPFVQSFEERNVKTLGMQWNNVNDTFSFKVAVKSGTTLTKRTVLSEIARIFDPLGLLGPVITRAKIFMQRLWLMKIDWQEPLPQHISQEWIEFVSTLPLIEKLRISRCVSIQDPARVVLHGFADASEFAYGAVLFLQNVPKDGSTVNHLLCSKSRVAPIKTLTIPRLELSACLLLAKLLPKTLNSLKLKVDEVLLWTDSTIALAWIRSPPYRLKTFVSHRVAQIQELTQPLQWGYVPSTLNPADVLSRGCDAKDLLKKDIWWTGLPFLMQETFSVPDPACDQTDIQFLKELKPTTDVALPVLNPTCFFDNLMNRTNSYSKLIRIISYIFRFVFNAAHPEERRSGPISSAEFKSAQTFVVKRVQSVSFSREISDFEKNNKVSTCSKLRSLNPFLDKKGIIRVGGRLSLSNLSFEQKHQIILPSNNKLTALIFQYFHKKDLHTGPQNLLHSVREIYWPLRGKDLARKTVHSCVQCFRNKPVVSSQIMGDLPPERITPNPPFFNSGLDFCGPFLIKYKGQRKGSFQKIYVAIFVCMVTKAVHFEFVSDLTSKALIATLKRFFARRGKVFSISSDNATNFVGTNSELKKLKDLISKPDDGLSSFSANENLEWKFIPPRAPHFGGLWEAGVKSFKHHLRRSVGNSVLTLEEFITITTQIEGILNSRPLTPLSDDKDNYEALTPAHFLIGRSLSAIAEPDLADYSENLLTRWQRTTKIVQQVWKKWNRDYLSHLNQRGKWQFKKDNVKPGSMILLKDEHLPPYKWSIGRILSVIPGKDKNVRVVWVKTAQGEFKRPLSRICLLPITIPY